MIAEDESLFVVMDALNQVRRRRRTIKLPQHLLDVTGRVAASFNKRDRFKYTKILLHYFNNDPIIFGGNF